MADQAEPVLLQQTRDGVAQLTLNRPAKANTLSEDLMDALEAAVQAADADGDVRVIVIGANGKIFCAGHDLADMQARTIGGANSEARLENLFARCSQMMLSIRTAKTPVIAKVQGAAVAAGCQLVAACDLAYASEGARFGVNGINLGLFCSTPSVALSRAVLPKQALEMLLTGQLITSSRAMEIGLINCAVAANGLDALVEQTAQSIVRKLPAAIRLGKSLFYDQLGLSEAQAYEMAGTCMAQNMGFDETRILIDDFLKPS
ncbi:MAG: enoyl-CoA hydratase [Beijerinckiaceae bacterium]|jgi:enoyl-CoA hydratase/carnithine racemase|nr:enoyl-CoA hydratase [Beijerinckiaceae bacterium]